MIAYLTGRVMSVGVDEVILDVNGVGYQLFMGKSAIGPLMGMQDSMASLYVETHVREDHIHLYGFLTASDRAWFRVLSSVSGVGARTAQAILSAMSAERIAGAIAANDFKALTAAEGVGPKLAQRIAMELKDKLPQAPLSSIKNSETRTQEKTNVQSIRPDGELAQTEVQDGSMVEDCVSALVHLGYDRTQAHTTCTRLVYHNDNLDFDAMLKAALQEMSS